MEKKQTELEMILTKTVEKQSKRIAALLLDLDLAHSQIEMLHEQQKEVKTTAK